MIPPDNASSDQAEHERDTEAPGNTLKKTAWSLPAWARRLITVFMALVAVGVLGWMIYSNRETLTEVRWQLHFLPLLASFLFYFIYLGVAAGFWAWVMSMLGSPVAWSEHIRIYYISTLASRMPIPLGYVASRLLLYDERTSRKTISVGSGLELVLLMLAGFALGLSLGFPYLSSFNLASLLIILALGLVGAHPRTLNTILSRLKLEEARRLRYRDLIALFFAYLLVWVTGGLVLYLLIASIYPISLTHLPRVIGAWSLSGLVAIVMTFLPFGLGLREITLGLLLTGTIPTGVAALVAIFSRIVLTIYEIILAGLASLFNVKTTRK